MISYLVSAYEGHALVPVAVPTNHSMNLMGAANIQRRNSLEVVGFRSVSCPVYLVVPRTYADPTLAAEALMCPYKHQVHHPNPFHSEGDDHREIR